VAEGAREQGREMGGMSRRTVAWIAWSFCALSLTLTALTLLLLALNLTHSVAHLYDYWLDNTLLAVSFSIIGAIIATRVPDPSDRRVVQPAA
jgi:hypothetical protein